MTLLSSLQNSFHTRRFLADVRTWGTQWDKMRFSEGLSLEGARARVDEANGDPYLGAIHVSAKDRGPLLHYLILNDAPASWIETMMANLPGERTRIDPELGGVIHAVATRIARGGDSLGKVIAAYPELAAQANMACGRPAKTPTQMVASAPDGNSKTNFAMWLCRNGAPAQAMLGDANSNEAPADSPTKSLKL